MRRTQIYLEDGQHSQLAKRAAEDGTTTSELIRRAIDAFLQRPKADEDWQKRWREAMDATFGIAPYLSETYVRDLRDVDARRLDELDRTWPPDDGH